MILILLIPQFAVAETKEVTARGSCAIIGMTSDQAIHIAKQRARSIAIEQAGGIYVSSSTLVTNGRVVADFIKSFTRGFIIEEQVRWLPLTQYQKSPNIPPVPEYGVEITAKVMVREEHVPSVGLKARLNRNLFRNGEKAAILIRTRKVARIAVFNFMADGNVVMLFPHHNKEIQTLGEYKDILIPTIESGYSLQMVTLPGHKVDTEGFFVAAVQAKEDVFWLDMFTPGKSMSMVQFFSTYSESAEMFEDIVLPYEIITND